MPVRLGEASYDVTIVHEPFAGLTGLVELWRGRTAALVTDPNVDGHYGDEAERTLASAGLRVVRLVVPAGEASKSFGELEALLERMIGAGVGRGDLVVALGGGVVGDLAGLAASLLCRGVDLVQLPTSLLAQVDSSVGGKTAVNSQHGKNLVGAFHQPAAVLAATACLGTLPDAELRSGLGEVVKTALLDGEGLLEELEADAELLLARDTVALARCVEQCVRHKAGVVERDEREAGPRQLLNLGHTLGHALERSVGYGTLRHGESVAVGIVAALELSSRGCGLPRARVRRVRELLSLLGLPTAAPPVHRKTLEETLFEDKKRSRDGLKWVVLRELGQPEILPMSRESALETLEMLVVRGVIRWETP